MNKITTKKNSRSRFDNNPFANKMQIKCKIRFFISHKKLEFTDVYKRAGISRATFYNLVDGKTAPTEETCRQLCIGLKLTYEESLELLIIRGFTFVDTPVDKALQKYLCLEQSKHTWAEFLNFLVEVAPDSTDGRYKIFAA